MTANENSNYTCGTNSHSPQIGKYTGTCFLNKYWEVSTSPTQLASISGCFSHQGIQRIESTFRGAKVRKDLDQHCDWNRTPRSVVLKCLVIHLQVSSPCHGCGCSGVNPQHGTHVTSLASQAFDALKRHEPGLLSRDAFLKLG